jgi:hypothetical protein|tara:strand:- start:3239 stop:3511 length:273 start_codon:yes stop_codon:yes gene_type:complete
MAVNIEIIPNIIEFGIDIGTNKFTPTTLLSDYSFIDNSASWNIASSWGDHTLQGYTTQIDEHELISLATLIHRARMSIRQDDMNMKLILR